MTTTDTASKFRYEGNGTTDTFSFDGRIFQTTDIAVDLITRATDALVETLDSGDYTVTIADNGTASVTVVAGKIPSAAQDILLRRAVPQSQSTALPSGTRFPAKTVEDSLDRLTVLAQDLQESVDRSLKLPPQTSASEGLLPNPVDGRSVKWSGTDGVLVNTDNDPDEMVATATTQAGIATTQAGIATTQAGIATTQAGNAESSANAAAISADEAQAAVGGVKVTVDDTTAGFLNTKLLVGTGLTKTTGSPGGDETLTVGIDDDAITPAKTKTTVTAIGAIGGGTQDIDLSGGVRSFSATVDTSATTFTFSNPKATGNEDIFTLRLTNGGSQTVNWPASVDWVDATAPDLTAAGVDELIFKTIDGGTIWVGAALLAVG